MQGIGLQKLVRELASDADSRLDVHVLGFHMAMLRSQFEGGAQSQSELEDVVFRWSTIIDEMPADAGPVWKPHERTLSASVERILETSRHPQVQAGAETPELIAAREILFADPGNFSPSSKLREYRAFQAKVEEKSREILSVPVDNANALNEGREQLARLRDDWETLGHKREVDDALSVLGANAKQSCAVAFAAQRAKMSAAERFSSNGATYLAFDTLPTRFDPAEDGHWTDRKVIVNKEDRETAVEKGFVHLSNFGDGDVAQAEFVILKVVRGWLDRDVLMRRDWQFIEGREPRDRADGEATSLIPATIEAVVLMRNLEELRTRTLPDPIKTRAVALGVADEMADVASQQERNERFEREVGRLGTFISIADDPFVFEVVDDRGQPIPGAQLGFYHRTKFRGQRQTLRLQMVTDENGEARVPKVLQWISESQDVVGNISVSAKGYRRKSGIKLGSARARQRVALEPCPAFAIKLGVQLSDGDEIFPITGARVQFVVREGAPEARPGSLGEAITNEQGIAQGLMPLWHLSSQHVNLEIDAQGYEPVVIDELADLSPLAGTDTYRPSTIVLQPTNRDVRKDADGECEVVAILSRPMPRLPDPDPGLDWG